ncbi:MAG: hypothetical protein IPG33_10030 [Betaproteobacteria bacterium]|nr:hypothetical protein [Betaproteobacteria bacterium]
MGARSGALDTFDVPATVSEFPTARVVIVDDSVEPIHLVVVGIVDDAFKRLDSNLLSFAVSNLRDAKHLVAADRGLLRVGNGS